MQHILVCDDEEDIVAALKIYLEADGYCVPKTMLERSLPRFRQLADQYGLKK